MSPEQAAGLIEVIGPASDIYTLGVTLYLLLTGQEAFELSSVAELLAKVQSGTFVPPRNGPDRSPRRSKPSVSRQWAGPEARYATCAAFAKKIEYWLDDEPVTAFTEPLSARFSVGSARTASWPRGPVDWPLDWSPD